MGRGEKAVDFVSEKFSQMALLLISEEYYFRQWYKGLVCLPALIKIDGSSHKQHKWIPSSFPSC